MPDVTSSAIARIEYDPRKRQLLVWFRPSGELYRYDDVPASEFRDLQAADSKGRFFNAHIRDRYRFERAPSREAGRPHCVAPETNREASAARLSAP